MTTIDLNANIGEAVGSRSRDDTYTLLDVVTSASMDCRRFPLHLTTAQRLCALCVDRGVAIGAEVGSVNRLSDGTANSGQQESIADVLRDISLVDRVARAAGDRVSFVRPRNAFYGAATDEREILAIVCAVIEYDEGLTILAPYRSPLLATAANGGLPVAAEGFPDRGYQHDGTIVPAGTCGARISGLNQTADRAVRMATDRAVEANDGTLIAMPVQSLRMPSDPTTAAATAACLRNALSAANISLAPFIHGSTTADLNAQQ